jgi:glycosyltransferase involved in cell wall biosynthesis
MHPRIDVLLATCNGQAYLAAMLDSLLAQTLVDFRVVVRDDASDDGTLEVLRQYVPRFGDRLHILSDEQGRLGVVKNFEHLLSWAVQQGPADWFAFADQDDVWLPEKLAMFAATAKGLIRDPEIPRVIFSDLQVVDRNREVMAPSFWRYEGIQPGDERLSLLLSRNVVTGCASMVNRRLADMALPFPSDVVMHDWWCALIGGFGGMHRVDSPLVQYRQHAANVVGAQNGRAWGLVMRILEISPKKLHRIQWLGNQTILQAEALVKRMTAFGYSTDVVEGYLRFRNQPVLKRMCLQSRYFHRFSLVGWVKVVLWGSKTPGALH